MQIKFITSGANSAFGGFSTGDVLRCSPELARHLVEEVKCAQYDDAAPAKESTPIAQAAPAEVAKTKRKAK